MIATRRNMIEMRKRFPDGEPITMYCTECGSEYSGDDGEYWNYPSNYEFTCAECKEEWDEDVVMLLGVKRITVDYLTHKS
jgi:NAD-dependent SIR2 family protein deacetylase